MVVTGDNLSQNDQSSSNPANTDGRKESNATHQIADDVDSMNESTSECNQSTSNVAYPPGLLAAACEQLK